MYLLGKRVNELTAIDINRLIENKIPESKSLDFKRELKLDNDYDKKEFLYDITSFFNTDGGVIVFGIEEQKDAKGDNTGIPLAITKLELNLNDDKLIQKIEDIIKSNTEPSITSVLINKIIVGEDSVLVLGINKFIGLPAMVTYKDSNKFYKRKNGGKFLVDVYELNQMFMQNQIIKEAAENFRVKRINEVLSHYVFPTLDTSSSLFLQIIPFTFTRENIIDLSSIQNLGITVDMQPLMSFDWDNMYNFDGFATFTKSHKDLIDSYNQIFRNGIYEIYSSRIFMEIENDGMQAKIMFGEKFITETYQSLSKGLNILKKLHLEPPFIICMSIHNVRGVKIKHSSNSRSSIPFVKNEILLPPIVIQNFEDDLRTSLHPLFDIIWQSVNYPKSPNL